jgi:AraC family transcriptional regulator
MLITFRHNSYFSMSSEIIPNSEVFSKESSYILWTKAKEYYGEACLPHFSIKSPFEGKALFEISNGRYRTDENAYLLLNPGQRYSLTVDSETEVRGVIIFIAVEFAEEIYRNMTESTLFLLENPHLPAIGNLEFIQRLHRHNNILGPSLKTLWKSIDKSKVEHGWYEEQLHIIVRRLLQVHRNVYQEIANIPAMRAGTREEIYRRVYRARDYIATSFSQPLTLNEIARIACLSPNHFMRTFKQVFRLTPYQYLTMLRLNKAKSLLRQTELPITEICFQVGFESLGSFSWLFHRRVGISPQAYRKQKK